MHVQQSATIHRAAVRKALKPSQGGRSASARRTVLEGGGGVITSSVLHEADFCRLILEINIGSGIPAHDLMASNSLTKLGVGLEENLKTK